MMKETKAFVRDSINTFLYFAFQGLYILVDTIFSILHTLRRFTLHFLVPSFIDLCSDIVYITRSLRYESCLIMNEACLGLSKFFLKSAEYFQDKAEQTNSKRAW